MCASVFDDLSYFNSLKVSGLFVREYGQGPKTVILVHGGPGLGGYMKTLGRLLQNNFRVVEYFQRDTPASGASGPFTVEHHVEDLKNIINHYTDTANQKPQVIGHSWGGCLTLAFLAKYRGLVEKAVILDPGPLNEDIKGMLIHHMDSALTIEDKKKIGEVNTKISETTNPEEKNQLMLERRDLATRFYFVDEKVTPLPVSSFSSETSKDSSASYYDWVKRDLFADKVRNIDDPVVVIHGEKDPVPYKNTFSFFRKFLPNTLLLSIADGGHYLWLDQTSKDQFLQKLLKVLE